MSSMPARGNMVARTAGDLHGISSLVSDHSAEAALPTTGVAPAGADVISALVAAQFAAHAHVYQAVSRQVVAAQAMLAEIFGGHPHGTSGAVAPAAPSAPARGGEDEIGNAGDASHRLLAAAAAWDGLAANLHSTAASYASLIGKLVDKHWQDPVSASMAAGASHHVALLSNVANHAKQAGAHAEHAAGWLADRLFRSA